MKRLAFDFLFLAVLGALTLFLCDGIAALVRGGEPPQAPPARKADCPCRPCRCDGCCCGDRCDPPQAPPAKAYPKPPDVSKLKPYRAPPPSTVPAVRYEYRTKAFRTGRGGFYTTSVLVAIQADGTEVVCDT
jgi:hypothetical protein